MNYKTTLVLTAIAAAALVVSAFPMVGTVFAQETPTTPPPPPPGQDRGDENTAIACIEPGEENDCRQQGFQLGRDNEQTNNFED